MTKMVKILSSYRGKGVSKEHLQHQIDKAREKLEGKIVKVKDNVNNPSHYTQGDIECIDAIKEATKHLTGIEAFCVGNVYKYLWRCELKNGDEDVDKAEWYLKKFKAERKLRQNQKK